MIICESLTWFQTAGPERMLFACAYSLQSQQMYYLIGRERKPRLHTVMDTYWCVPSLDVCDKIYLELMKLKCFWSSWNMKVMPVAVDGRALWLLKIGLPHRKGWYYKLQKYLPESLPCYDRRHDELFRKADWTGIRLKSSPKLTMCKRQYFCCLISYVRELINILWNISQRNAHY